VGEIRIDDE
jgi:hypothetical protein